MWELSYSIHLGVFNSFNVLALLIDCSGLCGGENEQFDNAAQEHQRIAYEQVDISDSLATNRTAAHMTSRFRDIKNNVEANFSPQQ